MSHNQDIDTSWTLIHEDSMATVADFFRRAVRETDEAFGEDEKVHPEIVAAMVAAMSAQTAAVMAKVAAQDFRDALAALADAIREARHAQ